MLEPENGDIAGFLPRVAAGTGEMAVDRRAVVLGVAVLDLEAVGQEGIAAGGIDQETGVPFAFAAVVVHGTDEYRIVGQELDSLGLAAFVHLDPLLCRIADQDGIELVAPDLVGVGHRLVPGLGKAEDRRHVVIGRNEFGTRLEHADGLHFLGNAHALEQRQVGREQGFADVETRVMGLFQHHHPMALVGQHRRHGRPGRPATDHQHVALPTLNLLCLLFHHSNFLSISAAADDSGHLPL